MDSSSHQVVNGLVLTGGGARAAYQVGVLRAISQITRFEKSPFQVISGYSAGAINGAWLAGGAHNLDQATECMWREWSTISPEKVYDVEAQRVLTIASRWLKDRLFGSMSGQQITYLLDTRPLQDFIRTRIDYKGIRHHLQTGVLRALSVTAANYRTGHSTTFFSGDENIKSWKSLNRVSVREEIRPEHVIASSAIPIFFSPVRLGDGHYGDGMVRLNAPLSAAVHMGSERLLVIGIRGPSSTTEDLTTRKESVTLGEIAGTILNGLFFDSLDADLARFERINRTISAMSDRERDRLPDRLRYIPVLSLKPSMEVGQMPECEMARLPGTLRYLLKGIGLSETKGLDLLSYLSFEPKYVGSLLELGYEDTLRRKDQVLEFFSTDPASLAKG